MNLIDQSTCNIFKAVAAIAMAAISMSASAAQWQPASVSEDGSVFVDLQSIEARGDQVHVRIFRHAPEPRFANDDSYAHVSKVYLVRVDCATGAIEGVAADASNKQFRSGYDPIIQARPVSGLDNVRTLACNPGAIATNLPRP